MAQGLFDQQADETIAVENKILWNRTLRIYREWAILGHAIRENRKTRAQMIVRQRQLTPK